MLDFLSSCWISNADSSFLIADSRTFIEEFMVTCTRRYGIVTIRNESNLKFWIKLGVAFSSNDH